MTHTCDQCPDPAVFEATRDVELLMFCARHGRRAWWALNRDGWHVTGIDPDEQVPV